MININAEVTNIVQEVINDKRIFTAYDITRILRHQFDGEKVAHSSVKEEVHSIHDNDQMGIYVRTQVDIGRRLSPFIYHLDHQDPNSEYDKDWVIDFIQNHYVKPKPVNHVVVSGSITSSTVNNNVLHIPRYDGTNKISDSFKTVSITKENRLNIPVKMLEDFTGKAYISIKKDIKKDGYNVSALSITTKPSQNTIKSYNINSDGRLRISKKFLSKIGISLKYLVKSSQPAKSLIVIAE